jgi:SAM-dependent methyltransferase
MSDEHKKISEQESAFARRVRTVVWEDPAVAAKFLPYFQSETAVIIPPMPSSCPATDTDDGLPVPPAELWGGHWGSRAEYLGSGKAHFRTMMEKLENSGFVLKERERVLDFGCGAGRVIRNFKDQAPGREIWGVDISAPRIRWCRENLCPPFKFLTTTTFPHLPFEDGCFDIIYAGSVFTQITDLAGAWLMELKRILTCEGRMYITVYDNHSIEMILSGRPDSYPRGTSLYERLEALEKERHFVKSGFSKIILSRNPGDSVVFYDIEFLRASWGNLLRVLFIDHEAFGLQTAVILGKAAPGAG